MTAEESIPFTIEDLQEFYDQYYDTNYSFGTSNSGKILPIPRESLSASPIPDFKKFLVNTITQPSVDFKTYFCGYILIGFPGCGKSTFLQFIAEIIQNKYGLDSINILTSNDFTSGIMEMDEKEVQVIFTDDAMALQGKRNLAGKALAKIRHISIAKRLSILYPEEFGYLNQMTLKELVAFDIDQLELTIEQERIGKRGVVYAFFNTQEFYGIAVDIRRQCKILIFKSASTNPRDRPELIKLLGARAFRKLRKFSESTLENKAFDENLSKAIVISLAHDEAGIVDFSDLFDRDRLRKIWKHVKIVNRFKTISEQNNVILALKQFTNHGIFDSLPVILLEELHKDSHLLSLAHVKIGKIVLKRNITLWYLRQFEGWEYSDLAQEFCDNAKTNTARLAVGYVRNFLKDHNSFMARISERFFFEQLSLSTVFTSQAKSTQFHLPKFGKQHADLYLMDRSGNKLLAVLAIKMHFARETYHPSPERQYAEHYNIPCFVGIIDVRGRETYLRMGVVKDYSSDEIKMDTVEIRKDFTEIIAVIEKELLTGGEEK